MEETDRAFFCLCNRLVGWGFLLKIWAAVNVVEAGGRPLWRISVSVIPPCSVVIILSVVIGTILASVRALTEWVCRGVRIAPMVLPMSIGRVVITATRVVLIRTLLVGPITVRVEPIVLRFVLFLVNKTLLGLAPLISRLDRCQISGPDDCSEWVA